MIKVYFPGKNHRVRRRETILNPPCGVDSSALAFLLKDKGVKTYSIGFDGGDVELKRAERVVCIWGLV